MDKVKMFLLFVYVICPFIDLYNGYVQMYLNSQTIIPVLFKTCVIVYSMQYMLRFNKATVFLHVCLILFLFCFAYWTLCGYVGRYMDLLRNTLKIVYPYSILVVLYALKDRINRNLLLHYILCFGLISSVSILLFDIIGIGMHSYGSNYGYGVKGLFKAGNDIGLSMIMCNCIAAYYLSERNNWKYVVYNIIFIITCLRLGSTAGIIGVVISILALLIQTLCVKHKFSGVYFTYRKLLVFLGIPLILYSIYSIVNTDSYTMKKFDVSNVLAGSARNPLKNAYYAASSNFSAVDHLFGIGNEELTRRIGYHFFSMNKRRALEVDHLEFIGTYGLLLGVLSIFYPLIFLIKYIKCLVTSLDLFSFWIIIAFCLFIFHGIFAGHAYTSISAMAVLVAFMFLADNPSF